MSDGETYVCRRAVLRTAVGTAGASTVVTGTARAQQEPDFGGWLDGVDGGFQDSRGEQSVTVTVGAEGNGGSFAFEPAGIWVDTGTKVEWEWTGQGGGHNVTGNDGPASDIIRSRLT